MYSLQQSPCDLFAASAEAWGHLRPSCKPGQGSEQPVLGCVGRAVVKAFFFAGHSLHLWDVLWMVWVEIWRLCELWESGPYPQRIVVLFGVKGGKDRSKSMVLWSTTCGQVPAVRMDALSVLCVLLVGRQELLWLPLTPRVSWCSGLSTILCKTGWRPSRNGVWGAVWKQLLRTLKLLQWKSVVKH